MHYYVYILSNRNNNVFYVGVTGDLNRRIYEHKNRLIDGLTCKSSVNKLVYFEEAADVLAAMTREKQINNLSSDKKIGLIEAFNPAWDELSPP